MPPTDQILIAVSLSMLMGAIIGFYFGWTTYRRIGPWWEKKFGGWL